MKESHDEKRIRERMAPGVLSREGFLGDDARRVSEIIDADGAALARLGLTGEAAAAHLRRVLDAAVAGLGTPVEIDAHLIGVHHEAMGRIPCPFGRCGTFSKGEVELSDCETGESLVFTPLSVHMIAEHGFCQGRGSCYRLEPAALARLFRLG